MCASVYGIRVCVWVWGVWVLCEGWWGGVGGCDEECHTGMESVLLPFPPVVSWTLSLEAGLQNHTV